MYGGDEISATVLEVGSHSTKGGFAGEDCPKVVVSSATGAYLDDKGRPREIAEPVVDNTPAEMAKARAKRHYIGLGASAQLKERMEVKKPCVSGVVSDWDVAESLWWYVLADRLGCNPSEHPLMLAEPSFNTNAAREKAVQLAFEKFHVPALFMAKNAVLSSFASARPTSLVVDTGASGTSAVPVHDGYVLRKATVRSPFGGDFLTTAISEELRKANVEVKPHFAFKKTLDPMTGKYETTDVPVSPSVHPTYLQFCRETIISEMKHSISKVSHTPIQPNAMEVDGEENEMYELPDGRFVAVTHSLAHMSELMMNPTLIEKDNAAYEPYLKDVAPLPGGGHSSLSGIGHLIHESVTKCDPDVRRELYSGVVLTGGNALLPGLPERIQYDLSRLTPQMFKIKIVAPQAISERRYSVWIGGSILSSLGSFQQLWVSAAEYQEHGESIIHQRCP
eukprot:TRINITY_DN20022_c0_g1::TRINITY_DN20022_c0_g1_i1::g.1329::m.1329 TRINITY_DN20022_c0_g1::TRINITY_DN20022_c0_g1_i1::g.1329  ORF type:complete len:450 (-),score=97.40,sp/Q84M92/ARP4_ARATH/41.19/3e-122,Actin/PF00022.14/9.7e-122,MreB_Mbl/PF06723.8/0.0066,MreB_Mbl/PF06723.8/0.012 TRINITY_DN20022_c0_g1_i1:83-1432(-)